VHGRFSWAERGAHDSRRAVLGKSDIGPRVQGTMEVTRVRYTSLFSTMLTNSA